MKYSKNQSGFTLIEAVIILVVLAIIGALGYTFYGRLTGQKDQAASQSQTATVPSAPQVTKTADLDTADKVLDQADPSSSSSDLSQLENMTSGF